MNDAEFEDLCERITNLLRFEGEEQAVAERDSINEQLAPEQNLHFQGPAGGNMLAFTLFDTKTGQVVKNKTKMWIRRESIPIASGFKKWSTRIHVSDRPAQRPGGPSNCERMMSPLIAPRILFLCLKE